MSILVLDTSVLVDMLDYDIDIIEDFIKINKIFIPSTVSEEFFNDELKKHKGFSNARKIYMCNDNKKAHIKRDLECTVKRIKELYESNISNNLIEIKRSNCIKNNKVIEFISSIKKKHLSNFHSNLEELKKPDFCLESVKIYNFFNQIISIIDEIEKENIDNNIKSICIKTREYVEEGIILYRGIISILENIRNPKQLFDRYNIIRNCIISNSDEKYKLSIKEKEDIKNYIDLIYDSENYYGKKDYKEKEDNKKQDDKKYNDQYIWYEIKKYSNETGKDIIFITKDTKDFIGSNLKEKMIAEFSKETNQKILICTLEECNLFTSIEERVGNRNKIKSHLMKYLLEKYDYSDICYKAIDDGECYIEKNMENISQIFIENEDICELLSDEEYDDEKYSIAIDALESFTYNDEDDIDIDFEVYENDDGNIIIYFIVILHLWNGVKCKIEYKCSIDKFKEDLVEKVIKELIVDSVDFEEYGEEINRCGNESILEFIIEKGSFGEYLTKPCWK